MYVERLTDQLSKETRFLPPECIVIFADCYPLKKSGLNNMDLIQQGRKSLKSNAYKDVIRDIGEERSMSIYPCDSQGERIFHMILDLTEQLAGLGKRGKEVPLIIIANENPRDLVKAADDAFKNSEGLRSKILPRITIIQLNAPSQSDTKDPVTGMRTFTLPRNVTKFPIHPTPAS